MPLLCTLGRKSTQVSNTTNAAEVDASKDKQHHPTFTNVTGEDRPSVYSREVTTTKDPSLNPGTLSFVEDAAGGMGRHLGVFSCTMFIVGRVIGTGIFSTPSSILSSVGSVGASLMLWALGFLLSFCGLFVWLEYPTSILITAGHVADRWVVRGIALGVSFFVTILHGLTPAIGVFLMNALSVFKIVILLFIVISGWVVLSGKTHIKDPYTNFHDAFSGSSRSGNDYATATFKVLNAYSGWSNINYVMNNVKNPVRTLKIAGPLGLGICAVLYMLANVAYFTAATKDEISKSGVTVAALFFKSVFGTKAEKALSFFVSLSALGNVITVTFTICRINQELAKEGVPLPFGNKFWASNWPTGKSPLPGLIIHLIPSIIIIIAPPPAIVYPFILDVEGYPQQIINFFIVVGLIWLRWKKPDAVRPFKGKSCRWSQALSWLPLSYCGFQFGHHLHYSSWPQPFSVSVYLSNGDSSSFMNFILVLVAPFRRPANRVGDTPPLPYYLYCLVGIGIMFLGVVYWAVWRIVLPSILGYKLVPEKDTLDDGTVVTVFSRKKI
ncbi:hypothetical protein K443DRAFT_135026 [Laccaria amethystina LaAM-08-1]|uniref:Unplaced genomic scaffold K443scaffold_303, whole genome shotgun sequence n=1 Tax=Laccaria amethystina LaAM-08-1 TaxID=1095629 RepID=A0A0C9X7I6_9AGAR|nr:hypothetical protein K443DRAFT_135026 [Laccaria amethystina LaAM-08-1]